MVFPPSCENDVDDQHSQVPPAQLDVGLDWDQNLRFHPDQPCAAGEDDLGQLCCSLDGGIGKEPVAILMTGREVKTNLSTGVF